MIKENKKITPNRSEEFKIDTRGVPYTEGNRNARRILAAGIKKKTKTVEYNGSHKKIKLPKSLWIKGKSKFLIPRLKEEGKDSVAELIV